jgi:mono/diheme cytochrome c family protein
MVMWRALYFRPTAIQADPSQSAEWNRGAYLIGGLGHCAACHAERNALGATEEPQALGGGLIPMQGWYAPSLTSQQEAGVAQWSLEAISTLLKTGTAKHASVLGPMAEVVYRSTQHLADADLRAMAVYLKGLPQQRSQSQPRETVQLPSAAVLARGSAIYDEQCASCHGKQGEGAAGAVPPLAGNRQLGMASANNVIRVVLAGGFAPATAGNPRPYGMPPFGQSLSDDDIAAVVSHLRSAFAAGAGGVSPLQVQRLR